MYPHKFRNKIQEDITVTKTLHSNVCFRISNWVKAHPSVHWNIEDLTLSVVLCLHFTMATVAAKRKLSTKSIKEKYAALKEVEGGSSKSQVAMKYCVPKNTLSTWIKNKERIFESMKTQGNKTKRMRLKEGTFEKLDELIFKWLLTVRSRNVGISVNSENKSQRTCGKDRYRRISSVWWLAWSLEKQVQCFFQDGIWRR